MSAGPCRNAETLELNFGRGTVDFCPCSGGSCLCTPLASHGSDRNLCGCWPEPEAPKATRRACRCGASLSRFELRHGLQCGACTRRDESLYGSGCGL